MDDDTRAEAEDIRIQNTNYETLLKAKTETPERFLEGESQTLRPLYKNQDVQCETSHFSAKTTEVQKLLFQCKRAPFPL